MPPSQTSSRPEARGATLSALRNLPSRGGAAEARSATYYATHDRTQPPSNQIVTTEQQNILLRQFHALAESKRDRSKRSSSSVPASSADEPPLKQPKTSR